MSLHKIFSLTERLKLDFPANAADIVNHPSFALTDVAIGAGHIWQNFANQCGLAEHGTDRRVPLLTNSDLNR